MSRTVDERVVSMQFDNKHFEKNVSTTMSTLDKLKQSLQFKGATKGLEEVNTATKNVNMTGLGTAVDQVKVKFSALQIMGVTALTNITNSAVNAGKRIVSALTIDPVKTGFSEYETQINAVQTILANTESKGTTLDQVNQALETLNKYADQTIYNFTEMTRNIGTFTAAGVDLDTSVSAIKGIANLAAVSGSTSQQASTAMYQLSQALSSGTVKLMDWNSVVNAGMGGQVFQDALKETARVHGVAIDSMIEEQGSFRETLSKGWLTSEILTETLEKFTMATEGLSEAEIEANRVKLKNIGYTDEQIESIFKLGNTATNAATKVKTFTQLWDVLKEAAQSGWSQTWKIVVGDFEEAKNLLTPLSEFFTGIINRMSDARNDLLESALGKGVSKAFKGIDSILDGAKGGIDAVAEPINKVTDALEDLNVMADKVIDGDFGNGKKRLDALTNAGYNYYRIQNRVNEILGVSFRHSEEKIKQQDELLGIQGKQKNATTELNDANKELLSTLVKMDDEQLRSLGYSNEQIATIRELAAFADKLGLSIEDLIANLDQINGRWLLIQSFKNIGEGLIMVFREMGNAFKDIFDVPTTEEAASTLFDMIAAFHKFTTGLKDNEDTAEKLRKTFRGVFAALDIVLTIVGGPLKLVFKAISGLLGYFNLDLLDVTAGVGDAIVKFDEWINSSLDFTKIFEKIVPPIQKAVDAIKEWVGTLKDSEDLPKDIAEGILTGLGKAISFVKQLFSNFGKTISEQFGGTPADLIAGFANGIWDGISLVGEVVWELGKTILKKFRGVLRIESPSKETREDGKNFVLGFWNGIKDVASGVWEFIKTFGAKCLEMLRELDLGTLIAGFIGIGTTIAIVKIADAISSFAGVFDGLEDVFEGAKKVLNSMSLSLKASALKDIAIAIAILAASVVVLALIPVPQLWNAVGVIFALSIILGGLSAALNKWGAGASLKDVAGIATMLIGFGAAMLMFVAVIKILESVNPEKASGIAWAMVGMVAAFVAIMGAFMGISALGGAKDVDEVGRMLLGVGAAMLLMAITIRMLGKLEEDKLKQGFKAIGVFGGIIALLMATTRFSGTYGIGSLGKTILSISAAMLLMVLCIKMIGKMDPVTLTKGLACILIFGGIITGLMAATRLAGTNNIKKLGVTIAAIGSALLMMAIVAKIMASMTPGEIAKGVIAIAAFGGIIAGLIAATRLAGGKSLKNLGSTLLMASLAIGVLAAIAVLLSLVSIPDLAKGIVAVTLLGGIMAGLIAVTHFAKSCKGELIVLTVAIGLLAGVIFALSFIDPKKLVAPTLAMVALMGMFAIMIAATKLVQKSMGTLIVMTGIMVVMAGLIYLLSVIKPDIALDSVLALSILMLSMAGVVAILSAVGVGATKALIGVLALTALAIPLIIFTQVLKTLSGLENATTNVLLLVGMMTAMTLLLPILIIVGALIWPALLGVAALTLMAVPMLAFVGVLALMDNIQNATKNINLLIGMMGAMTSMLVVLAPLAPLAVIAVVAIAALTTLMVALGALAIGIGYLMDKNPDLQKFLDTGIPVLIQMAGGIGKMIGAFVTAIAGSLLPLLPALGSSLSMFMVNVQPFVQLSKTIDSKVLEGVGFLAAAILALTVADLIASLSRITGGFALMGLELSAFMVNVLPFILGANMINPASMDGIKTLAEAIIILTAADVVEGLTGWFTGGSSLTKFGEDLALFAPYLVAFANEVGKLKPQALTAMGIAAEAGKMLAEMADTFPNSGGWLGKIFGENDADTFGKQIEGFGKSLKAYGVAVDGIDKYQKSIEASVGVADDLVTIADSMPNSGGLLGKIFGENDPATFGTEIESFGKSLKTYGEAVNGIEKYKKSIEASVEVAGSVVDVTHEIPNSGGIVGDIFGDNDPATFGNDIVTFGDCLVKYGDKVSGLGDYANSIKISVEAAGWLVDLANIAKEATSGDYFKAEFVKIAENAVTFGGYMAQYAEKVKNIVSTKVANATKAFRDLVDLIRDSKDVDANNLVSFSTALGSVATDGVDKFVQAFTQGNVKATRAITSFISYAMEAVNNHDADFKSAGTRSMSHYIQGLTGSDSATSIKVAMTTVVSRAILTINSFYQSFYTSGSYVVSGFSNAIADYTYLATEKARSMASAALTAINEELGIDSPSKEGYASGNFFGIGFIGGIVDNVQKAYSSGGELASYAKDGLNDALDKLGRVSLMDIDAQPTIRPVLDLSDVQAGMGTIGSLFNNNPSVGVMANVRAINSSMSANQNGTNNDVVSAINRLGKSLGNMGSTYNINGVSVDDDNAVVEAVKTIVGVARRERRS